MSTRGITCLAVMSALMLVCQIALAPLPNIEAVTLILMALTLVFGWKTLFPLYVFVLLEGLIYGFALWWFGYLYVWLILVAVTYALRKTRSYIIFAAVAGCFGLFFGAFFALIDLVIGGPAFALAKWVSGIPFDFIHCFSNLIISLLLLRPVRLLLERLVLN